MIGGGVWRSWRLGIHRGGGVVGRFHGGWRRMCQREALAVFGERMGRRSERGRFSSWLKRDEPVASCENDVNCEL